MSDFGAVWRKANILGAASLITIFVAALGRGAAEIPAASLLAMVLLMLLAVRISLESDPRGLLAIIAMPALAALALICFALLSATPLKAAAELGLTHPINRFFGQNPLTASLSPYRTLEGTAVFFGPCAAFVLGAASGGTSRERDVLGRWLGILSLSYAAYALGVYLTGWNDGPRHRLDAAIGSANAAATLFGVLALFAAAQIVRMSQRNLQDVELPHALRWLRPAIGAPISVCALMLCLTCALLTASRAGIFAIMGAVAAFAIFLAILAFRRKEATAWTLGPVLAVVGLGAVLFALGNETMLQRLGSASGDFDGRMDLWRAHWGAFLQRPLIGHGLNTFFEISSMATTPENWNSLYFAGAAHNIFLQVGEEVGLIGLALFALIFADPVVRAARTVLLGQSGAEWSAATLAATLLCFGHGLVDFGLQVPAIGALMAFVLGAFAGGIKDPQTKDRSSRGRVIPLRVALLGLTALMATGAVTVLEASSQTREAFDLISVADALTDQPARESVLDHAMESLEGSWARPLTWHAGAMEAASAIAFERAATPQSHAESAHYAALSVRASPVQPHAWTRLAVLASLHQPNAACTIRQCLEFSWRAAPMIDVKTACVRLRLAYESGLFRGPADPKIVSFAQSGVSQLILARCLSFLAPDDLFPLLLQAPEALPGADLDPP